jgi:hypothetical protein
MMLKVRYHAEQGLVEPKDKNWLENYKIALSAYLRDPQSLRGGYKSVEDHRVCDWVKNQKRKFNKLSKERQDLLRVIEMYRPCF